MILPEWEKGGKVFVFSLSLSRALGPFPNDVRTMGHFWRDLECAMQLEDEKSAKKMVLFLNHVMKRSHKPTGKKERNTSTTRRLANRYRSENSRLASVRVS